MKKNQHSPRCKLNNRTCRFWKLESGWGCMLINYLIKKAREEGYSRGWKECKLKNNK